VEVDKGVAVDVLVHVLLDEGVCEDLVDRPPVFLLRLEHVVEQVFEVGGVTSTDSQVLSLLDVLDHFF